LQATSYTPGQPYEQFFPCDQQSINASTRTQGSGCKEKEATNSMTVKFILIPKN
jgi:hypothetical protein